MEFNELMQQFAAKIGLSELTPEGDGVAMEIEGVPFGFLNEGEAGTMIIIADIGKQPESADAPLGSMMLKANFMYEALDGAVLFQNPENEAFGIQQRFRIVDLDVDSLYAHVERLSNLADEWKEIVAGYGQAAKVAQEQAAKEPQVGPFAGASFMRV